LTVRPLGSHGQGSLEDFLAASYSATVPGVTIARTIAHGHARQAAALLSQARTASAWRRRRLYRSVQAECLVALALSLTDEEVVRTRGTQPTFAPPPRRPAMAPRTPTTPTSELDAALINLYGEGWSQAVADKLYVRLLGPHGEDHDPMLEGDPLIAPYFAGRTRRRWLERHQALFLRALVQGNEYEGRSLTEAHLGVVNVLNQEPITDAVFDRVVWHVVEVLKELECPQSLIDQVSGAILDLRDQVVAQVAAEPE
jgi:hypothetical protein